LLRIARALGFLAPIAVALFITVVLSTSPTAAGTARDVQLLLAALALIAGMTSTALAAWSYMGWRLNRIARALEDTLDADLPVQLQVASGASRGGRSAQHHRDEGGNGDRCQESEGTRDSKHGSRNTKWSVPRACGSARAQTMGRWSRGASWHSAGKLLRPRVRSGRVLGRYLRSVPASDAQRCPARIARPFYHRAVPQPPNGW